MVKIYTLIWFIVLSVAAMLFLMGNFTMFTGVVFGFIAFGLIFTGMMCVLPSTVGGNTTKSDASPFTGIFTAAGEGVQPLSRFIRRWFDPRGVEIRRPRFH